MICIICILENLRWLHKMALLFGEKNVSPAYSTSFEAACFEVTFVPMVLPLPEIQQLQMHGGVVTSSCSLDSW